MSAAHPAGAATRPHDAEHVSVSTPAAPRVGLDHDAVSALAARRVVPLARPGRWVATAVVLVLLAQFVHGLVSNPFFEWHRFGHWFARPVILDGIKVTLLVTLLAAILGLTGGVVLALGRLSANPLLRVVSWAYIWVFRSVPLIVVILFLYNFQALYTVLGLGVPFGPQFVSFNVSLLLTPWVAAVLGLGLPEAAYAAEVVRGGVLSVDHGQWEAAHALGLSRGHLLRRIVLPQALRTIVPAYVNLLIGLIKGSSLVFYASLLDLFGTASTMYATHPGDVIPLLMVASVWYIVMTTVLSIIQFYVERHYARGAVRTLPLTPWQQARSLAATVADRLRPVGALR